MEHRHGNRRRTLALVKIKSRQGSGDGIMYNLNRDGMFIVSEFLPRLNDSVKVLLSLTAEDDEPVCIQGIIVHHTKNGFGLMFQKANNPAHTILEKTIPCPSFR